MMRSRKGIGGILMLLIFCFMFAGCLGGDGTKPLSEMTSQQKSIMMFDMYNKQFTSYMLATGYSKEQLGAWKKTSQPVYTDDERDILQKKKAVLQEVYPLIGIYDSYSTNGAQVTPEMEAQIFNLLDQLVKLIPD